MRRAATQVGMRAGGGESFANSTEAGTAAEFGPSLHDDHRWRLTVFVVLLVLRRGCIELDENA
jgi:hypothetical protein